MVSDITQHGDHSKTLPHTEKLSDAEYELLLNVMGRRKVAIPTPGHITNYRQVVGRMLFIGRLSAPPMLLQASIAA